MNINILKILTILCCLNITGCNNSNNNSSNTSISSLISTSNITSTSSESTSTSSIIEKDIDVVVLCGQSNAEGHSLWFYLNEEKLSKYREGFESTKIRFNCGPNYNFSRTFVNVKTGQGNTATKIGPELGMAEYFEEQYEFLNKTVYLIKYAVGGTSLYSRWRSPSSTIPGEQPGDLYTNLINYCGESIALLEKQGFNPTIRAICWMQGESDAGSEANYYKKLENDFINDLNVDLEEYSGGDTIKFIDAGISQSPAWANYQIINNAKKENCELDVENRFYIDTILEGLEYNKEPLDNPDIYHYDAESMVNLGRLFAQTLVENAIIEQA